MSEDPKSEATARQQSSPDQRDNLNSAQSPNQDGAIDSDAISLDWLLMVQAELMEMSNFQFSGLHNQNQGEGQTLTKFLIENLKAKKTKLQERVINGDHDAQTMAQIQKIQKALTELEYGQSQNQSMQQNYLRMNQYGYKPYDRDQTKDFDQNQVSMGELLDQDDLQNTWDRTFKEYYSPDKLHDDQSGTQSPDKDYQKTTLLKHASEQYQQSLDDDKDSLISLHVSDSPSPKKMNYNQKMNSGMDQDDMKQIELNLARCQNYETPVKRSFKRTSIDKSS